MKTSGNYIEEFIFANRNKEYGAYFLRKIYFKSLLSSIAIGIVIFMMGVSVPVISNYLNKGKLISEDADVSVTINNITNEKPIEKPPDIPAVEKKKAVVFRAPVVITEEEEVTEDLADIIENTSNTGPLDTATILFVEVPEEDQKIKIIEEEKEELQIHTFVEEFPVFPGGDTARIRFLSENLKYPRIAKESGIQGIVYVTFVVEKDGSISNASVIRGIGGGCDEEALRVVRTMPKWNPGRQNGKEVRVQFNMSITFRLI